MDRLQRLLTWTRGGYEQLGHPGSNVPNPMALFVKRSSRVLISVIFATILALVLFSWSSGGYPYGETVVTDNGIVLPDAPVEKPAPGPKLTDEPTHDTEAVVPIAPPPAEEKNDGPEPPVVPDEAQPGEPGPEPHPEEPHPEEPHPEEPHPEEPHPEEPQPAEHVEDPAPGEPNHVVEEDAPTPPAPNQKDRRLVVVTPVNGPGVNLCKFMMSAIALGYPSPIITNWGRDPFEASKWEGGPNLAKITGILRYLDASLDEGAHPDDKLHEDDIVIISDGFDVWFQLPPEVLLQRFHEINARANARLREQWSQEDPMPMEQTIVFSAQKRCWPGIRDGYDLHCDELPESPFPADLYGDATDIIIETNNPGQPNFHNVRPRFINGGTYMGAAGDLRRAFRRGFDQLDSKAESGIKLSSEQGVSGQVFGEQEVWRNWRRKQSLEEGSATILMERDFEYHIGLDYTQELSLATCHSENHGDIVALGNQSAVDEYSSKAGLVQARVQGVPEDVVHVRNPLDGYAPETQWGDMPLYTDFYTQAVPAMVHHNAWQHGLKERRFTWWDRMWFFPYLRDMVASRLKPAPLEPLATIKTDDGDVVYWAPKSDEFKRKPRLLVGKTTEPLEEASFDVLCAVPSDNEASDSPWWDEVFRDDKGPL
ncbi:uncharacterized protein J7T54_006927 [Emericellopsis cladophorae]|uniref:Uncharacterized protein n=1 Tax=Emericellopsis cladophorae TaxID=2686198 RepID=A0A9Q0BHZ4_9HYPO|nr:uncharacterized protein J7T54_006927 [Emericellopsis cladophorae]KAI6785285.1 hypothetical protein J7T54_006927 [Emericellopsis cladophorae]